MPHALWVISTLANDNRSYSKSHIKSVSHLFYYFTVVHFLAWVVSDTFTDKCSAKDSRRLTRSIELSVYVSSSFLLCCATKSTHLDLL